MTTKTETTKLFGFALIGLVAVLALLVSQLNKRKQEPNKGSELRSGKAQVMETPPDPARVAAPSELEAPRASAPTVLDSSAKQQAPGLELEQSTEHLNSEPSERVFLGQVLDHAGTGVPAVPIVAYYSHPEEPTATRGLTDSKGFFNLKPNHADWPIGIQVETDHWTTTAEPVVRNAGSARNLVVVVSPFRTLTGQVLASGQSVAKCEVSLCIPDKNLEHYDKTQTRRIWQQESGPNGRFQFERLPTCELQLETKHPEYLPARLVVTAQAIDETQSKQKFRTSFEAEAQLLIELQPKPISNDHVTGTVVHQDGRPASGAKVQLVDSPGEYSPGHYSPKHEALSDQQGHFRIDIGGLSVSEQSNLLATLDGYQAAVQLKYGEFFGQHNRQPPAVQLVLGKPTQFISGQVLLADGNPAVDWNVSILSAAPNSDEHFLDVESLIVPPTQTSANGSFKIECIYDRDYTLKARQKKTLLQLISQPIAAGSQEVVLQLPPDAVLPFVRGQVTSLTGRPLANVKVTISQVLWNRQGGSSSESLYKRPALTDSSGHFQLPDVPRRHIYLSLYGDNILPGKFSFDGETLEEVHISVPERYQVRIELDASVDQEWLNVDFEMLDEQHESLLMYQFEFGTSARSRRPIREAIHQPLAVSEAAKSISLRPRRKPTQEFPLNLQPGVINIVKLKPK